MKRCVKCTDLDSDIHARSGYGSQDERSGRDTSETILTHVSYVYEDICREKIWDFLGDKCTFNRVGRWWGNRDIEIDIVAYDSVGTDILFGECKYSKNPKGMDVLEALKEKANSVTWNKEFRKEYFCIFSKNGFSPALEEYAKQHENIILASLKMPHENC